MKTNENRSLKIGDKAKTMYNEGRFPTVVTITGRCADGTQGCSQSGVLYRVDPPLRGGNSNTWYDADWFLPLEDAK